VCIRVHPWLNQKNYGRLAGAARPNLGMDRVDIGLRIGICVLSVAWLWAIGDGIHGPHITVVGDSAPDFEIVTEEGRRLSRADYANQVLVLNFWATWCETCVEEIPSLRAFQAKFGSAGVHVLAISVDENEKAYRAFLERFPINFETARDPRRIVSSRFGTFQIPETYIIGKDGRVAEKVISNRDWMDPEIARLVTRLAE
jgi:cytochrome c biogenesis protein CcmG/thiol:disulfide interchange protein DsbE